MKNLFYKEKTYTDRYGNEHTETMPNVKNIVIVSALAIFLFLTLIMSFVIIPTGYTGVRTTFGQVDNVVVANGFNWKIPWVQKIAKVNNKQQEMTFFAKDNVWGESSEQTVTYMSGIVVTYKIEPEYSAWLYANVSNCNKNAIPDTLVASAMKASMRELATVDVTNRAKIEPAAVKNLQEALNTKYNNTQVVTIINVNIDNMDFEDTYNEAIAQRQLKQIEYEQQEILNRTMIETAEATANKERIDAQGVADAQLIKSKANAEAALIEAEAEAKANKMINDSLTDRVLDKYRLDQWNGSLPTTILGSDTGVLVEGFINYG